MKCLGVLILALVVVASPAQAAIAHVQTVHANTEASSVGSQATSAFTLTAGNLVIVDVIYYDATATVSSVTDTASNTWTQIGTRQVIPGDNHTSQRYYAKNVTGNASEVVTATFSANVSYAAIIVSEYSGLDTASPLDTSAQNTVAANTTGTTSAFTTDTADELIYVMGHQAGTSGNTFTAGTGYTLRNNGGFNGRAGTEEKIVSATQSSVTADLTSANAPWGMRVATFRAAGAGGATARPGGLLLGVF